ncbi:MAG: enoyl-CoA hydratase/isomerase family protein [Spirochaetales bacterium]|nr:enoyl-CoA hydratase/isomerase family protein [Spirochaetales bacterium]
MSAEAAAAVDSYVDSSVLVVTLARSGAGNRLNPELLSALHRAIVGADEQPEVRAVLLRSDGPVFCHGMDLEALRVSGWDLKRIRETVEIYTDLLFNIHTSSRPVVAVVRGEVKAGGVGLASACDVVIGTTGASFEMAEVLFGIVPANVLPFLLGPRLTLQKARALVLTAKKVEAAEALRLGLLDELVEDAELEKKVKDTLKRLLAASPRALQAAKTLTGQIADVKFWSLLKLTRDALIDLLCRPETQKAIEGFLEGELPSWYERFKPQRPLTGKE